MTSLPALPALLQQAPAPLGTPPPPTARPPLEPPPAPLLGPFWEGWVLLCVTRSQWMTRPRLPLQAVLGRAGLGVVFKAPTSSGGQVVTRAEQTQSGGRGQPQAAASGDATRASHRGAVRGGAGSRCHVAPPPPPDACAPDGAAGARKSPCGVTPPSLPRAPSLAPLSASWDTASFARRRPPRGPAPAARA